MLEDKAEMNFFFFNDTATTEIYTLSLHDALPISNPSSDIVMSPTTLDMTHSSPAAEAVAEGSMPPGYDRKSGPRDEPVAGPGDRKSTRLNSSHANISYAVFCLKKKQTFINIFSFI